MDCYFSGLDFWTGGLNPGLLWIWSNSARPIIENSTTAASIPVNTTQATPTTYIYGDGRCLALAYDPPIRSYIYRGLDCSIKYKYVCEKAEDKTKLSNEIERVAKKLRLDGKARKPKIIWTED